MRGFMCLTRLPGLWWLQEAVAAAAVSSAVSKLKEKLQQNIKAAAAGDDDLKRTTGTKVTHRCDDSRLPPRAP
jgi:uncharacterized membrane protein